MPGIVGTRRVGRYGLLLELPDNAAVVRLFATLDRRRRELGLTEVIPGHRTVLVVGGASCPQLDELTACTDEDIVPESRQQVTIEVRYDGVDLNATAADLRMSVDELVRRHTAPVFVVGFLGFAPGFAYLLNGDPTLAIPRRPEPRARVPAGSVAIAGEYTAIYPTESPGGWHLLGHTDTRLFDVDSEPPSHLTPGDTVRLAAT